jgi:hypothetical protein
MRWVHDPLWRGGDANAWLCSAFVCAPFVALEFDVVVVLLVPTVALTHGFGLRVAESIC